MSAPTDPAPPADAHLAVRHARIDSAVAEAHLDLVTDPRAAVIIGTVLRRPDGRMTTSLHTSSTSAEDLVYFADAVLEQAARQAEADSTPGRRIARAQAALGLVSVDAPAGTEAVH